jgi:hypothetical protein
VLFIPPQKGVFPFSTPQGFGILGILGRDYREYQHEMRLTYRTS